MDASGKLPSAHQDALEKARRRSDNNRQQQHQHLLTIAAAQQQALLAAQQTKGDAQQQLQLQQLVPEPEVAEGDEALFGQVEGEALRLAAVSVRDGTEELSDAEEELFVNNTGEGCMREYLFCFDLGWKCQMLRRRHI
jgi:hypothetical protein